MPDPTAVAHLGFIFHTEDFFVEAVALAGAGDPGAFDNRLAQDEVFPIVDGKNAFYIDSAAFGNLERLNLEAFARADLILFTTGFNYRVNSNTSA